MTILTFVKWYYKTAVYLSGQLIYYGDLHGTGDSNPILTALGYKIIRLDEIPTHNIPSEFVGRDEIGHWKPPELLIHLRSQMANWKGRVRKEEIVRLKEELARLEEINK